MILILGNSPHLIEAIERIENTKVLIVGWRTIDKNSFSNLIDETIIIKKIYIIGYDYASYKYDFKNFISRNVLAPLNLVKAIRRVRPDIDVIYINTNGFKNKKTYSRYSFAKARLAELLSRMSHTYVINLDTIVDTDRKPIIRGGMMSNWAFATFVHFKIIRIVTLNEIISILENYKYHLWQPVCIKGAFLKLPRSQFLDRTLRLICG